uniref:BAI1-associated protein 3 n=1 Tax=Eptatretus burgeri TaxID=7764 RepID=A0A8C4QJY9_EPTBU
MKFPSVAAIAGTSWNHVRAHPVCKGNAGLLSDSPLKRQWQVYSKHCFHYDVSYDHLLDLLQELDRVWETGTLTRQQGEALSATFVMFADNSLEKIHNIREFFPAAEPASLQRLSGLLKCLAFLYNSKIFKQLCVNQNELQLEITCVIKKGTSEWYNSLLSKPKLSSIKKESADTLGYLSRLVAAACSDTWQGREYYSGIFNNCVNIDYLSLSYLQLDKLVSEDVGGTMRSMSAGLEGTLAPAMNSKTSDALLGLHACLDELHAYHTSLTSKSENDLALSAFPTWFGPLLTKWLEMARKKAAVRIWQAVQTDKLDRIDSQKKCSSSIDEVMNCLSLLREFCLILAPPNSSQQLSQLAEDMCGCILRYTELTKTSLQEGGYYRHDGHFDVTVQLCTALNNVEHTRQFLLKQCQLQQPEEPGVGLQHPEQLDKAVHAAEQGIQHQLDVIVALFAKKMEPDIKKYIKHISLSPDSIHLDDAVSPLMKYLDDNLALLSKSLLIENFNRMLRALWRVIVNLNIDAVAADPPHSPEFFARFHYTMQLLLQFFHADGKGIPIHNLRTEEYMALQVELTQSKQSTQELIECYFVEMLAQQRAMESSQYGTLTVRCVYELVEQKLYVEVLSASNLIALDANGLSDPFVIVEVCPPHVAPKARSHKTSVKSKTLHPVFNEQFCFAVPPDCCRKKGACILFTVMDHDWLSRNDFAGEACISLATMTGFGGHIGGAMTARPPLFSLPLSQPQEGRVLKILEERVSDREAQDFIKRRKGLISGALDQ